MKSLDINAYISISIAFSAYPLLEMQRYTFWVYRYITSSISRYSDILHDMA